MYARDTALIATPIGNVRISGNETRIESISIEPGDAASIKPATAAVRRAAEQLNAWFAGTLTDFDLPLAPAATSRGAVLRAGMLAIRYAETMSYAALARAVASSPRAVGQACARNPFPIVVPCHRVLNADGGLGAYSAGNGPATKIWLLDHEQRHNGGFRLT